MAKNNDKDPDVVNTIRGKEKFSTQDTESDSVKKRIEKLVKKVKEK